MSYDYMSKETGGERESLEPARCGYSHGVAAMCHEYDTGNLARLGELRFSPRAKVLFAEVRQFWRG